MATGVWFDIAVSFADEQRSYVEQTVAAAKGLGISVFYDRDANNDWWGRDFVIEQRRIYGESALFVVPFISKEYLARPFPMDEFSSALVKAVRQRDPYILPVLVGDVKVPAELLNPHVGFLRAEDHGPEQLAVQMKLKVDAAKRAGRKPKGLAAVVGDALKLPKVVPSTFSKYRELDAALQYLGDRLEAAGHRLGSVGYETTIHRGADRISVVIERAGRTEYALHIAVGGQGMGADKLTFTLGRPDNGMSAWMEPLYDRNSQRTMLRLVDFSLLDRLGGQEESLTREAFFDRLWIKIIEELERHQ